MIKSLPETTRKTYLMITVCILLFAMIVFSLWFFSERYFAQQKFTSYSEQAIKPPVPFSELRLHNQSGKLLSHSQWLHKWVLFYVAPLPCRNVCSQNLHKLRQVYQMYSQKSYLDVLVATFFATGDKQLAQLMRRHYTRFVHVYLKKHNFLRVFAHVKSRRAALFWGTFYLVNPQGKVIMDYPANIPTKVIESDLS